MRRIYVLLILAFSLHLTVFAQSSFIESLHLKDGTVIKGIITEQVPNQYLKIQTADGKTFTYNMEDVEKMTKEVILYDKNPYLSSNKEYKIKGYRGFVDLGYTIGVGTYDLDRIELTTSHGYQFSSYFFAGIGTGAHYYCSHETNEFFIPLFADFRGNLLKGPIVPFAGLKAGYVFRTREGIGKFGPYFSPSVGVKFMITNKAAMNISLGYVAQFAELWFFDYWSRYSDTENLGGLSFKVGFEF